MISDRAVVHEHWYIQFVGYKVDPRTGSVQRWKHGPYKTHAEAQKIWEDNRLVWAKTAFSHVMRLR